MSDPTKNHHPVAETPAASYTRPVSPERAAGHSPWWHDVRLFWVPVIGILMAMLGNNQRNMGNLQRDMASLREELALQRGEMTTFRAELRQEMAALRGDLQEQIGDLGQRITRIETLLEIHLEEHRTQDPEAANAAAAER